MSRLLASFSLTTNKAFVVGTIILVVWLTAVPSREFLWWALLVLAASAAVRRLALYWTWLRELLYEPLTYLVTAVFIACGGILLSNILDLNLMAQRLLLATAIFVFIGLIIKGKKGPLL